MSTPEDLVEIELSLDETLLARIDRLQQGPGYATRSEVVSAAIDATAGES